MAIILKFKRALYKYLAASQIAQSAKIVTSKANFGELPAVKFSNIQSNDWQACAISGKIINLTFEVISNSYSSTECLELAEQLVQALMLYRPQKEAFIILRRKGVSSNFCYLKEEELWMSEVEIKYWLDIIN